MQLKMGIAVVTTAPVGVPPTSWQHSPGGDSRKVRRMGLAAGMKL
jgi:hypothetical protein